MIKNRPKGRRVNIGDEKLMMKGDGRRRTISISNTRNRTARRKNRRENGSRAEDLGSKPHSKGEAFSRSLNLRYERIRAADVTATGRTKAIAKAVKVNSIDVIN